ncbi:MAG: hypothetical protein R3F60_23600 [bacterium]
MFRRLALVATALLPACDAEESETLDAGVECAAPGSACGTPTCVGQALLQFTCSAALACEASQAACPADTLCEAGQCVPIEACQAAGQPCGAPACAGSNAVEFACDADLDCVEIQTPCPADTQCEAGACVSSSGCAAPGQACGAPRCIGETAVTFECDADLDCVEIQDLCPADTTCSGGTCAAAGACRAPGQPCGEPRCIGETAVTFECDADLDCVEIQDACPADTTCSGGACVAAGACRAPGQPCGEPRCIGDTAVTFECDADLDCVEIQSPCGAGFVCAAGECAPRSGGGVCACSTPGATIAPAEQGCGFEDATECSGWQSVIIGSEGGDFSPEEEAEALDREVPDGTVFCAFECCLQISCP